MEVTDKILSIYKKVYVETLAATVGDNVDYDCCVKTALQAAFNYIDDKETGSAAELDIVVDEILAAKDLARLKETTLMNFPEKKKPEPDVHVYSKEESIEKPPTFDKFIEHMYSTKQPEGVLELATHMSQYLDKYMMRKE